MSIVECASLEGLAEELKGAQTWIQKREVLALFLEEREDVRLSFQGVSLEEEVILMEVVACGKGGLLKGEERWRQLVCDLKPVESFFSDRGGVVGYQAMMLKLLHPERETREELTFHSPAWWDFMQDVDEKARAVDAGIEHLPQMAEIYPLGGAGDRLALIDSQSGEALPAATLKFLGKTLLQGLIEDLQAREYLYFKRTGRECITPVAIMTSDEKGNHERILRIFEKEEWFGRPKESFRFFKQPLVPVVDGFGKWCFREDGRLLMKPGGHGVIWKRALEAGIFAWFRAQGRSRALVRQVNNPVAGCDGALLALAGIGCREKKAFGVASCPRVVGSHEGMVVLKEGRQEGRFAYCQSNIEYCEFEKRGIVDTPERRGSPFSKYPSNTNILFVDLDAIEKAMERESIPGMLVNRKRSIYINEEGVRCEGPIARLESTMQNIADHMIELSEGPLSGEGAKRLGTFLTYNERKKTISCTKKKRVPGASLLETPEGAFFDVMANAYDLLVNYCGMDVPKVPSPAAFFSKGPSFLFSYHPALGPSYAEIASKIRGGKITEGSALHVQMAEFEARDVVVDGSVCVRSEGLLGAGRCKMKNVRFVNRGIDKGAPQCYWQGEVSMLECAEIVIEGTGEFIAEDVTFYGPLRVTVRDGQRLVAREAQGEITLLEE